LLIFIRMTGLFVVTPIFGRRNIPTYFKIGFAFLLALIMVNTIQIPRLEYFNSIYMYALLALKEFLAGVAIGYVSYLVFTAIYLSGQVLDMQIGFGIVNVIDPLSNIQVPITSNFYFILCILVFFGVNGHHMIIRALFDSYRLVPIGSAVFDGTMMNDVVGLFGEMFKVGFKIAAPVVAALLVCDVALGVISKAMPQLNVFIVGMPLKIILGILVVLITIPVFITLAHSLIGVMNSQTYNLIKDMGVK